MGETKCDLAISNEREDIARKCELKISLAGDKDCEWLELPSIKLMNGPSGVYDVAFS